MPAFRKTTCPAGGAHLTKLIFSAGGRNCGLPGNELVCFGGLPNWNGSPQNLTTWTAGYAKGTTVITLGNTSGLIPGVTLLILDQANDTSDTGQVFVCDTSICRDPAETPSPGRTVGGVNYNQQEYKLVTAVKGNQVTISPPLYMPNWRASQKPSAWARTGGPAIVSAGIEDLSIQQPANLITTFGVFNAYNCWIKGVRSIHSGDTNGARNQAYMQYSARITIRDSYFYGNRGGGNLSYTIEPWQSGDLLVENNFFQHSTTPLLIGNTIGSVFAYNYSIDHETFRTNPAWNMPGPSWTHDAGVSMNLIEGNQGTGMIEDDIHGTHNLDTYFRNQWSGRDPTRTQQTNAVLLAPFNRYMNIVGNVMGEGNYHNRYENIHPSAVKCDTSIFIIGWHGGPCTSVGLTDGLTATTLMRWGNYDTVNNAVRFDAGENGSGAPVLPALSDPSRALPPSFYLSAKPTWWPASKPWPAVGPDVAGGNVTSGTGAASTLGGHAYKIPARDCYETTPQDGANPYKLFNAAACYRLLPRNP